ncbi:MAG: hypothetical protein Q4E53_07945, partial [Eubacteriales bacterium]|nr:hypothetical protein [Eubacteriales bacterium]
MLYKVLRIDEDIDFGCEERLEGAPVMAVVTLENAENETRMLKMEDAMLYERDINESDMVYIDEQGKLAKELNISGMRCHIYTFGTGKDAVVLWGTYSFTGKEEESILFHVIGNFYFLGTRKKRMSV